MIEYTVTVDSTVEPVAVADFKDAISAEGSFDEGRFEDILKAARQYAEEYTRRTFIEKTIQMRLDAWPTSNIIYPVLPPLLNVQSVTIDGVAATGYTALKDRLVFSTSKSVSAPAGGIAVTYTAGYGATAADVPQPIKEAIISLANDFITRINLQQGNQETRSIEMTDKALSLLRPYCVVDRLSHGGN